MRFITILFTAGSFFFFFGLATISLSVPANSSTQPEVIKPSFPFLVTQMEAVNLGLSLPCSHWVKAHRKGKSEATFREKQKGELERPDST